VILIHCLSIEEWVKQARGNYLVNGVFGFADISVGSMAGFLNFRSPAENAWEKKYPCLYEYWKMLEKRPSFQETVPKQFINGGVQDKVV
jgi:glutathione S-transferase